MARVPNFWIEEGVSDKNSRQDCCGCTACENSCKKKAIAMKTDQEGFAYPAIDNNLCVDCGLCATVCPVSNPCDNNTDYIKVYAGYSTNSSLLNRCATGGVGTALALSVTNQNGIVFGVQYSENNKAVEYGIATTVDDVLKFAGSKYVQTCKHNVFNKVKEKLIAGKEVLFTGCPCDIAGLKKYLIKDYDNLLTCELICAGITSQKVLSDYWQYRERVCGKKLKQINMRHKLRGWFVTSLEEIFADGSKKYKNFYATYLGHAFLTFPRPSCLHCQYRGRISMADIKIGDFWGIKDTDDFWNPQGVSVIMVKTKKGLDALARLDEFKLFETSYGYATAGNPSAVSNHGKRYVRLRNKFGQIYIDDGKGLIPACKSTASKGFWVKHFTPDVFHPLMKKVMHKFIDSK